MAENSYGDVKRLVFTQAAIAGRHPARVLDVGCGTGANLTLPLARLYPQVAFFGTDTDAASLEEARRQAQGLENLKYGAQPPPGPWDMIIASEVIEHVDDPRALLDWLRTQLAEDGVLVMTLPNGYGLSEMLSLSECLATLSGLRPPLARFKRWFLRQGPPPPPVDSLAVSPHVNFFSLAEIRALIAEAGLEPIRAGARTFACGWLIDRVIDLGPLADWNARIADHLPMVMSSDWMFELRRSGDAPVSTQWRRGPWARWRRHLNLRRWSGGR